MPLVKVKSKYQVTLPDVLRRQVRVGVGDLLEAKVEKGKITFTPKAVVDRDEYTPRQRRVIDREIAKGLDDIKNGRIYGPFETHEEMIEFLHRHAKKARKVKNARPTGR